MKRKSDSRLTWKEIVAYSIFVPLVIVFFVYPEYYVGHFIFLVANHSPIIELSFTEILMFLWGIGIVVYSTSVGFLRKIKFTPKIEWCLEKLNSMILNLFIFGPFVLFCFSDSFMEKYNYMNCEELEVVGYKRSKSIYTNSQQICEQLIEEKKKAGRY